MSIDAAVFAGLRGKFVKNKKTLGYATGIAKDKEGISFASNNIRLTKGTEIEELQDCDVELYGGTAMDYIGTMKVPYLKRSVYGDFFTVEHRIF